MSQFTKKKQNTERLLIHLVLIGIALIVLLPIFSIVTISLSKSGSLKSGFSLAEFSLDNWKYILGIPYQNATGETVVSPYPMMRWLFNSLKVSLLSAFLMLFCSTTAAYALSRFKFKGKEASLMFLMVMQMFPNMMAMVAFYFMLDFIGVHIPWLGIDTHGGLILIYLGGTPFNIWLLKGYFDTLPRSIEESARMDGCTHFQAFTKIVLPLCTPMLAVIGLLTFISTFSDFILPSILLKSQDQMTFAVGIQIFISESFASRWGQFAAASILGALPISLLFFSIHRYIVDGLSQGGVKG
ncbi:maltose ABC transporter permease MalG [Bacteriovorax stolpii]|uniref:Maltose/maltodextrin transport system permease protein MalG n=1 Tax=Bacteriovorax stolpii TaxID=960 RepID=A0A2K9NPS4_BACTC|nr:maltose ABC transporter permease MalG [Bacteriovorax stolpii]AUN97521.1 maltose ABC transporter permease MalG [Bacteriovorax stolpii]QDK42506.1 maltose ABC transporter permease MalG [Bacteriovorax stolpii]TDP52700.1 maltooligosaccharide ABC transporter membrane protein [Bacteriovorax stolpii]